MGIDPTSFTNYGCSMIYGHPQVSTAGRLIIEGIEEAAMLRRRLHAVGRLRRRRLWGSIDTESGIKKELP